MGAVQNNTTPQQTQQRAAQLQQPKDTNQKWQKLVNILKDIKEDLRKEEDIHLYIGVVCAA